MAHASVNLITRGSMPAPSLLVTSGRDGSRTRNFRSCQLRRPGTTYLAALMKSWGVERTPEQCDHLLARTADYWIKLEQPMAVPMEDVIAQIHRMWANSPSWAKCSRVDEGCRHLATEAMNDYS